MVQSVGVNGGNGSTAACISTDTYAAASVTAFTVLGGTTSLKFGVARARERV